MWRRYFRRPPPNALLLRAFSDVTVREARGVTVLSADLPQAGMHGLFERVADLGLELVGVRHVAGPGQPRGRDRR